ncbi:MAG: hemagglutinin repeat-containing protein [Cellvibrio sp.]|nr:hemagglutinin repeat-containing protein [Cellvibrio sp.]
MLVIQALLSIVLGIASLHTNLHKNPDSKYLIETRPEFTLYENFLSSDYLLDALGYNADQTIKRLGDAFFENMLIRDALIKETNSRYIGDITNDYDLMQLLMDNAVTTASNLQLSIGVELTPEQCASLTQDMMWLVKKKINGQEVLVPHLYLTSVSPEKIAASKAAIGANGNISLAATSINNQSSMFAGKNLSLSADLLRNTESLGAGGHLLLATRGDLQQDGRLFAQGDVRLLAAGQLTQNGSIDANNVIAIAQGNLLNTSAGKMNAAQNIFLQSTQGDVVNNQGQINGNNITLDANKNVELTGNLSAQNNLKLIAGQDVLLKATKVEESVTSKKVKSNSVQYTATNLAAGGNITVEAGRDIQAEGSDFTAGGNINLQADRDVNLQAMKNESNYEYKAKRKKEIHNTTEHDLVNVKSGGTVSIDAGRDNNLVGTNITANDDVYLSADRDTNISAVVDSDYDYSYSKKKKSFGRSKTKIDETLVENVVGGTIDAGNDVMINAVADAEGNIGLTNSRNVNLNGAVIASNDGDVVIAAKEDVTLGTVEVNSIDYHLRKKSGVGGLTGKSKSSTHNSTEQIGTQIQSGNDAVVLAGSDATLISAAVMTKGDVQIDAGLTDEEGDVNLLTANNTYLNEEKQSKKSMNLKIRKDGITFDKTTKNGTDSTDTYQIGNFFSADCDDEGVCGGDVNLSAKRDINIVGSTISGKNITADAGRDVNLLAAQDDVKSGQERSVSRNGISWSDDSNGVTVFAGEETNRDRLETRDKVSISTSLNSTESTIITANRDINLAGSEINSEKSIRLDAKRNVTIGASDESYQQINEHENIKDGLTVTANHNLGNLGDSIESLGDLFDSEGNAISDASTGMRAIDAISNSGPSASAHLGRTSITEKQTETNSVAYGSKLNAQEDVSITAGETATVHGSEVNAKRNITIDANDINITASENTTDSKSKNSFHKTGLDLQGGKGNVSLTGGFTLSSSETTNKDITANASKLNAENISLTAKNDINVKGSDLLATRDITLDAVHDVNITSAEEYTRSEFDSEYKSLNAGVSFGKDGMGFTANGSIGEEELDRKNITHRNSQVNAGEKLSITSGNDTTLKGANVSGKDVDVNVGNNLTIASEQNTGDVKGHKYDASFSVTVGAGVSASVSVGYGETEGSSAWTANQTSLTGSNSINVNVKNHTQLDGAVLGNMTTDAEGNKTAGNNFNLTTKTFGFTDLKDHDKEKSTYVGVSIGGGKGEGANAKAGVDSYGIDAQYSSHNKKQDTLATLGNGNITIQSDIENGTDSLAGINRDLTETQIITKDKSTNIDVYVQSDTIDMLANKDRRDHLVARMTDPSRLIGDSLGFMEIFDGMENALFTVAQGEIKAPTDEQLKGMTQEQRNLAWAEYNDKKENQGFINTSNAVEMDNSVKDFTVATRQNIIGVNHEGGLNLLSFGEGNNLIENYERLQDGRYNTLDGRANLSNQIQFTGQDGKNKDGVDILNNATLYSVDGNQAAMQYLVDGMTGRTDIDAALYSQTVKTGLPGEAKAVAINNNETNTHIVGVNIDKTDLQNQSDFITSIAEEARHSTNPDDHNANQYAAQAAYVWREENINEGRQTGQGVGIDQWREDNKNDATIAKNNVTIGSQRARDMEFRQLQLPELKIVKDNAKEYADKKGITEQQARQELTQQALLMVDDTWASQPHIQESADARAFLLDKGKGQTVTIETNEGTFIEGVFTAGNTTKSDFTAGLAAAYSLENPDYDARRPGVKIYGVEYGYEDFLVENATLDGTMPKLDANFTDETAKMFPVHGMP